MTEKSALDMIFEQAIKNKEARLQRLREYPAERARRLRPRPVEDEHRRERRQRQREAIAKLLQQHAK